MAESYEGNGEYSYNDEETDFKRKRDRENVNGSTSGAGGGASSDRERDHHERDDDDANDEAPVQLNQKATDYLHDCMLEKSRLEKDFPIAGRLLNNEIETVQKTGRIPSRDVKYADIYREKPLRVAQKIRVPVREHPKFNFVGKLLGPKGNSLKRLQEDTLCKMTVLGRNSMRDRAKEEELRSSMDTKYAHLNEDLHVEVSTVAPPAEAYARIAYAMAELRKYLTPDSNDEIRQEQLRELLENPPPELEGKLSQYKKIAPPSSRSSYRQSASTGHSSAASSSRTVMPQKQKVFSILEKARSAIDDSYRRGHAHAHAHAHEDYRHHSYPDPSYDAYSYGHHSHIPPSSSRVPYEQLEYDPTDYRTADYYSQSPSYAVKSKLVVKTQPSSSPRTGWKSAPSSSAISYSSSSRRHDDHLTASSHHTSSSASKHAYSSREARYKSAPYPKPK